jgi:hypothetical protein
VKTLAIVAAARRCPGPLRVRLSPTGALILEAADETRLDESA